MASERNLPTPYAKESDREVQQEQALSLRVKARDAGRRFWVRVATSNPQPQFRKLLSLSAPITTTILLIGWKYASFQLAIAVHVALSLSLIPAFFAASFFDFVYPASFFSSASFASRRLSSSRAVLIMNLLTLGIASSSATSSAE